MLERINFPSDIKNLSIDELTELAKDVRDAIINRTSKMGGHIGPNLGAVELTVALHFVFNSPVDKLIFDVSHQSYAHKILTGRKNAFLDEKHFKEVNGFTNRKESEHDIFSVGHTSTSVSLALGLADARDKKGTTENIIAIIGDGSLSGGEALEGLDFAGDYKGKLIIIINDNEQSIAENHGGLYGNLAALRKTNGTYENNFFKALGLEYMYLDEGHSIAKIIECLLKAKEASTPIVIHIHTTKGKGLSYAEKEREKYHQGGPYDIATGEFYNNTSKIEVLTNSLIRVLDENPKVVLLNAATPARLGFNQEIRAKYVSSNRFIDVGIAEEHAMAMASGIARNGLVPIFGTLANFLQRTYDQFISDVCLNNSHVVILSLQAGIYGLNSETHMAMWDIKMFAHIPNAIFLAPTYAEEYNAMLDFAINKATGPVVIRVPNIIPVLGRLDTTDYSIINKAKIVCQGSDVAIFAVSNMLEHAKKVANIYKERTGNALTIINPCFLSGLDTELLDKLANYYSLVISLEDTALEGGYGQTIASYYSDKAIKFKAFGIAKTFYSEFKPDDLLEENGMGIEDLVDYIISNK